MPRIGSSGFGRERALLRLLAKEPASGMRLSDLADISGLGRSTVHRLLASLKTAGFVDQDPDTRRYHLGFELFMLGQAAGNRFGILEMALPSLQRIVDQTEDTVYMSTITGLDSVCLARLEGSFPIKTLTMEIGERRPLGVGSSSITLLSFLPDEDIVRIVETNVQRYKQFPLFDIAAIHSMVDATRRQGFALTDGLIVAGMRAVGVPVFDRNERPVAALTVGAIDKRMQPDRINNIAATLQREARRIEHRLQHGSGGSQDPEPFESPGTARRIHS